MFTSSITINDSDAQRVLKAAQNKLLDLSYENKLAAERVQTDIQEHFNNTQSPVGKWKPSIRVIKHGGKTLTKSGALRRSLSLAVALNVTKIGFSISSDLPYASIHNNGGKFRHWRSGKYVTMPKRQYAWVSAKAKQEIIELYIRGF